MTVWQKQCLLCAFGYLEPKGIDGIWGPKSAEATGKLQKALGLPQDGVFGPETAATALNRLLGGGGEETEDDGETGSFWEDIQYFKREEFRCKCGGQYCGGFPAEPKEQLVKLLDAAREHFGSPAHIVSGLRCPTWNSIQVGVANSQHMYGEAADVRVTGVTADDLLAFFQDRTGVRYTYKINATNVHVDVPKGAR